MRVREKSVQDLGVAQLVARYLGVVEAASSSLVTQTISSVHNESDEHSIFFAYISLFGAGYLLFFLLLCRGGQIVYRNALSALKGDLALSVPFGNLQTTNKAVMDNNSLCAILARSLNLINLDLLDELTKNHGIERFQDRKSTRLNSSHA